MAAPEYSEVPVGERLLHAVAAADVGEVHHLPKRGTLYERGQDASGIYVVQEGIVFTRSGSINTKHASVDVVARSGRVLGIEGINGSPYENTAIAGTPATVLWINNGELPLLDPTLLSDAVLREKDESEEHIRSLKIHDTAKRIELAMEDFRVRDGISVSQKTIGERAGVHKNTVSKHLNSEGIDWLREASDRGVHRNFVLQPDVATDVGGSSDTIGKKSTDARTKWRRKVGEGVRKSHKGRKKGANQPQSPSTKRVRRALTDFTGSDGKVTVPKKQLAEMYGIPYATFNRVLEREGIVWGEIKGNVAPRKSQRELDSQDRITRALDEARDSNGKIGVSQEEVARRAGATRRTVRSYLEKEGLSWKDVSSRASK